MKKGGGNGKLAAPVLGDVVVVVAELTTDVVPTPDDTPVEAPEEAGGGCCGTWAGI